MDGLVFDPNINSKYTRDLKYLITNGNGTKVLNAKSGKLLHSFNTNRYFEFDVPDVRYQLSSLSPDEQQIVVASGSNEAKVFEVSSGKLIYHFKDHSNTITELKYTSDGRYIITASLDGSFIMYDPNTGKQILRYFEFEGEDDDLWVHLHPDGFFDASEKAMELMYWTKGLEVIEFSQLKDRYWVPGLWQK